MSTRSDSRVEEDIQILKEWLQKKPHIPQDIDKRMLTAYVKGTKSMERAKEKLENYFLYKSKMPIYFNFPGRDPEDAAFKRGCEATKLFILPKMTREGYAIVMCVFDLDVSKFDHHQLVTRITMMVDMMCIERPNGEGIVFLCDLKGLDASILPKLSLPASAFYLPWLEKAVPSTLKHFILYNAPKFMDIVVNTFIKPFMSQKMQSRMVVTTGDISIAKEIFPEQFLPCDFGGLEKSSADLNNYWLEKLKKNRDWFEEMTRQVIDETMRLPDSENTFGVNGTFRSFNVD